MINDDITFDQHIDTGEVLPK